jgi:pimeloyl-ACP methyl ester carboxylesterase
MPEVIANGIRLHYTVVGRGEETIVFSHSFLASSEHFRPQLEALSDRYHCIAFDHRGHGYSEVPREGYDMETIYDDAEGFIEALGCGPCHFVGLSTGGFVGMRLAIRRPDLLRSLVLMDTSADEEPPLMAQQYKFLGHIVRRVGWRPVLGMVMRKMFARKFLDDPAQRAEVEAWRARFLTMDTFAGPEFGVGISSRESVFSQLGRIRVPTLVMVGEQDIATPPSRARRLAAGIEGAELVVIPDAGHLCTVEEPAAVNAALEQFLAQPTVGAAATTAQE